MFNAPVNSYDHIQIVSWTNYTFRLAKGAAVFDELNADELWITFGKTKDLRKMPIHSIVRLFDP